MIKYLKLSLLLLASPLSALVSGEVAGLYMYHDGEWRWGGRAEGSALLFAGEYTHVDGALESALVALRKDFCVANFSLGLFGGGRWVTLDRSWGIGAELGLAGRIDLGSHLALTGRASYAWAEGKHINNYTDLRLGLEWGWKCLGLGTGLNFIDVRGTIDPTELYGPYLSLRARI